MFVFSLSLTVILSVFCFLVIQSLCLDLISASERRMAFWCRISQSKVKHLYSQFKRVPYGSLLNSTVSQTKPCVSKNPFMVIDNKPNGFGNSVRLFAAPVQVLIW